MFQNIATIETSLLSVCSKSPEQLSDTAGMWHLVYDKKWEFFFFLKKKTVLFYYL